MVGAGSCAFLLWMLTDGAVSVKLALLAPAGILIMVLQSKFGRAGTK
jgi:hypothetical protein